MGDVGNAFVDLLGGDPDVLRDDALGGVLCADDRRGGAIGVGVQESGWIDGDGGADGALDLIGPR